MNVLVPDPIITRPVPKPEQNTALRALRAIIRERSVMAGMQVFHDEIGDMFRLHVPGFSPVVMVGPEACRFVLVEARDELKWRIPKQPIVNLLDHGLLVEDGEVHDTLRRKLMPPLHKQMVTTYVETMVRRTDQITATWESGTAVDLLVEARKMTLLTLMDTLFDVDFTPEMTRLWDAVKYLTRYISPGLWLIWEDMPRLGYRRARAQVDGYWHDLIVKRRAELTAAPDETRVDMLSALIHAELDNTTIRDQLMTMLIAGHDTATAALAWTFHLLGGHPDAMGRVQSEIDTVLNGAPPTAENVMGLTYLGQIIDETLRLYPPVHLGGRTAAVDLVFDGFAIPAGTRVLYSIYLTQRHRDWWHDPHTFDPERFAPGSKRDPYIYLPFGGGARTCIGLAFAQVEMRVILARLLQQFTLSPTGRSIHVHMGATLEPRPGVIMTQHRRG